MPRGHKSVFNTTIDTELLRGVKRLAADKDSRLNELLEEAIKDLMRKHGRDDLIPKDIDLRRRTVKQDSLFKRK
jgi:hypothetical protein